MLGRISDCCRKVMRSRRVGGLALALALLGGLVWAALRNPSPLEEFAVRVAGLPAEEPPLDDDAQLRTWVAWETPQRTVPSGADLRLMGHITLVREDHAKFAKARVPIRVLVARHPGDRPDWRRGHRHEDTLWNQILWGWNVAQLDQYAGERAWALPSAALFGGTFLVHVRADQLTIPPGTTAPLQVGLCLGGMDGDRVFWRTDAAVLPHSVRVLDVPGPSVLSPALQRITACPGLRSPWYYPTPAIQAANYLRSTGKEGTLAALREFLTWTRDPGNRRHQGWYGPGDAYDDDRAALLLYLLTRVRNGNLSKMTLWQGIPFHTFTGIA